MDTAEKQAERVRRIHEQGHRPIRSSEMGYATERCAECGTFWPCPEMAQAREWRDG